MDESLKLCLLVVAVVLPIGLSAGLLWVYGCREGNRDGTTFL